MRYLRCVTNMKVGFNYVTIDFLLRVTFVNEMFEFMASSSKKVRISRRISMLNEVASIEEMPLIQLPQFGQKGMKVLEWRACCVHISRPADGDEKKNKLSMIFGVTLPCILSIFSVILFLRLGLIVGQVCPGIDRYLWSSWKPSLVLAKNCIKFLTYYPPTHTCSMVRWC